MLAQPRSITSEQLSTCRVTAEQDYALEDVLSALWPARHAQNKALLEALDADPLRFTKSGLCIKRSSWNGTTVYVAPLVDALKFVDIQLADLLPSAANAPNSHSPVAAAPAPPITEADLRKVCRVTSDGRISIYDALALRDDTNGQNARRRFQRFCDQAYPADPIDGVLKVNPFQKHQFQSEHQATPVAYFHEIMQLFSLIPGPGAATFRAQQFELVRDMYRDGVAAPQNMVVAAPNLNVDVPQVALSRETSSDMYTVAQNPVASIPLMKITEEDLRGVCRVAPDGRISVYDALAFRDDTSVSNAGRRFLRYRESAHPAETAGGLGQERTPFQTFTFGSEQPTPVAYFHEIMKLFALIPGPGVAAHRAQQAELSARAMAGDLDLERAVHDRRAALPASAQEVMLAGLESSADAKRMRAEQFESDQRAKKPRLSYTGEQLVHLVKGLSTMEPNADLLSEMWEQCEGVHTAFMAQYVKYCELQMTILQFNASLRREDERVAAELKLKELQVEKELKLKEQQLDQELKLKEQQLDQELKLKEQQLDQEIKLKELQTSEEIRLKIEDYKLKERQAADEFTLKSSQASERNRLSEHRLEEELKQQEKKIEAEIKIKREEASANIKLLTQKTQTAAAHTATAEKEVEAASLKTFRLSKQRDVLSDSDRRSVLQRTFPKLATAKCDMPGCLSFVCAFRCSIVEDPTYTMGDVEKLRVVCLEHAKAFIRSHKIEPDRKKLNTWVYRVGAVSHTKCALCGDCDLAIWGADTNVCHVIPVAMGGRSDNDNLVIGSIGCNLQQGPNTLADYQQWIRRTPIVKTVCVPEPKLDAVIQELQRRDKRSCTKCPLERIQTLLTSPIKRVLEQTSIRPLLTKRSCR